MGPASVENNFSFLSGVLSIKILAGRLVWIDQYVRNAAVALRDSTTVFHNKLRNELLVVYVFVHVDSQRATKHWIQEELLVGIWVVGL